MLRPGAPGQCPCLLVLFRCVHARYPPVCSNTQLCIAQNRGNSPWSTSGSTLQATFPCCRGFTGATVACRASRFCTFTIIHEEHTNTHSHQSYLRALEHSVSIGVMTTHAHLTLSQTVLLAYGLAVCARRRGHSAGQAAHAAGAAEEPADQRSAACHGPAADHRRKSSVRSPKSAGAGREDVCRV